MTGITDEVMQLWSYEFEAAQWELQNTTVAKEPLGLET